MKRTWLFLLLLPAAASAQSTPATRGGRAAAFVGRITDLAGAAIAGARLRAGPESAWTGAEDSSPESTRSAQDGRFTLHMPSEPDAADGPLQVLVVSAPGRASARIELPAACLDAGAAPVDLGTIALPPGRVVRGMVQSHNGRPVAKARVRARDALTLPHSSAAVWAESGHTGDNGVFTLPGVVAGPLTLEIEADGFAARTLTPVHGDDLVQIDLAATGFVTGRVQNAAKDPPFRGEVRLVSEWSEDGPPVRVGEDGSFRLPIPWLGRFCVVALAGDTTCGHSRILDGPAADLKIPVTPAAGLRVRARDAVSLTWIPDFRARWFVPAGTPQEPLLPRGSPAPDRDGVLLLTRPRAVPVPIALKLVAQARGYDRTVVDLLATADEQVIDLTRSPGVVGRVLGPDLSPRAHVRVSARTVLPRGVAETITQVLTDAEGRFAMGGIPSGTVELFPTGPSGIPGTPATLTFQAMAEQRPLALRLPDETVVSGTATGAPPGTRLAILPDRAWAALCWQHRRGRSTSLVPPAYWAHLASDGQFETCTLLPSNEDQVVALWTPGGLPGEPGVFTVAARHHGPPLAGRVTVDVAAGRPATVRGRVAWNGPADRLRDVALVAVPATGDADAFLDARLCAVNGARYGLRLAPGAWALSFRDLASRTALPCVPDRVDVTAGAELELELMLKAAAVDLRIEGPDRLRPCVETLLVICTPHGLAERPMAGGRTRRPLILPALDLRGAVRAVRFLAPEGNCILRMLPSVGRLAPEKAGRADSQSLVELQLVALKSGEVRSDTLTLPAALPIAE